MMEPEITPPKKKRRRAKKPGHTQSRTLEPIPEYLPPISEPTNEERLQALLDWRSLKLTEILTVTSFIVIFSIAAFNAGYFGSIPGRFHEIFSVTDYLVTNMTIMNYFLATFIIYYYIYLFCIYIYNYKYMFIENAKFYIFDAISSDHYLEIIILILGMCIFILLGMASEVLMPSFLFPQVIFMFLFHAFLVYTVWVGYRYYFSKTLGHLIWILGLNIIFLSYDIGRVWLRYDVRSSHGFQAIVTKSAGCLDRKIIRGTSAGYLLYSKILNQFEFREKSDVITIFERPTCT